MRFEEYEAVIGLEVHAELKTNSKVFCTCSTAFGASPNTQCCPVCMGLPGAMPMLNRRAVELAVMAGVLLNCKIAPVSRIDRKQYFYPDLPKAYQISQGDIPLCRNGYLELEVGTQKKRVGIARIHIEEDAGKLIHEGSNSLIDYNRCGIGLIEIVSEPSIRSGEEAATYLRTLRALLSACAISDCKMQEGSLRCDVNISVRKKGSQAFGVRTEIKNLNSFAFVQKAIDHEFVRQCELLETGGAVEAQTRRFDPATGKTYVMRSKESVSDYRFLIEPDLLPISISEEEIAQIATQIPELPSARSARLCQSFGIRKADADILVSDVLLADYFEAVAKDTKAPVIALNLLLGEVLRMSEGELFSTPIPPHRLGALATLLDAGTINHSTAKKLLSRLAVSDFDPIDVIEKEGLAQIRDESVLRAVLDEVLALNVRAVNDYKNGKTAAMRALQGQAMAKTAGRADPVLLEKLLLIALRETIEKGE